jgi:hypothetical protein
MYHTNPYLAVADNTPVIYSMFVERLHSLLGIVRAADVLLLTFYQGRGVNAVWLPSMSLLM